MRNIPKHKLLLIWLIYLVSIISLTTMFGYIGLLQIGYSLDRSFISYVITGFYLISEMYLGYLVIRTSKELIYANEIGKFLYNTIGPRFSLDHDSVIITDSESPIIEKIPDSFLAEHIKHLLLRSKHWSGKRPRLDQEILLSAIGEKLFEKNSWADFSVKIILLGGLIGTIVGIVLSFWPFIDPSSSQLLDVQKIQANLPKVFGGVGAAFFPSIFAAIFSIFLTFMDKMLQGSSIELISEIAEISETYVIPVLEKRDP